jgi:hypothetical protein
MQAGGGTFSASSIIIDNDMDSNGQPATINLTSPLSLTATSGPIVFLNPNDTLAVAGGGTIMINADGSTGVAVLGNLITSGGNITVNAVGNICIGTVNAGSGQVMLTSTSGSIFSSNGTALAISAGSTNVQGAGRPASASQSASLAELNATQAIATAAAAGAQAAAEQTTANAFKSELTSIKTQLTSIETAVANDQQNYNADGQLVANDTNTVTADQALLTNETIAADAFFTASAAASLIAATTTEIATGLLTAGNVLEAIPVVGPDLQSAVDTVGLLVFLHADFFAVTSAVEGLVAVSLTDQEITDTQTLNADSNTLATDQSNEDQAFGQLNADLDAQTALVNEYDATLVAYQIAQQAAINDQNIAMEDQAVSGQAIAAVVATATPQPLNVNGPLTLSDLGTGASDSGITISSPVTSMGTGAGVTIQSNSPLSVNASITAPGPVNLTAATQALPETGDNLTVNSGVTIQSTGSSVSLLAGDNVVIPSGATIQAGSTSTITITGDANDNPSGATVTVNGTLSAASALIDVDPNSTGPDTFNITPSATTPITVTGGAGTDTLNFNAGGLAVTLSGNTITAAGMQPVTFSNIAHVNIINAAHGGANYTLAGTSGQANTLSLAGTAQASGTVTLNGVALSFSGVASFNYQGGSGDTISVTPYAASGLPWNVAVTVAGGAGSPASLTYNSVASLADIVTATGAGAGTIGSPGLASVQFSNVGTLTTNASSSPGDELTVNLRGTAAPATLQSAGPNSADIQLNGLFGLDIAAYAGLTINASDMTGNALFEIDEAAALEKTPSASLNIHVVGNSVYNDHLLVKTEGSEPAGSHDLITPGALASSGSVTVGALNPVTYQDIGSVKFLPAVTVTDAGGTYNGKAYAATAQVNGGASLAGIKPTLTYYRTSGTFTPTVDYYNGTFTPPAGAVRLSGAPINAGTYAVVASFAGAGSYAKNWAYTTFTISQAKTQVSVHPHLIKASPMLVRGSLSGTVMLTVTVDVRPLAPGACTPTGTVSFYDGTTFLGKAKLIGGVAKLIVPGKHAVTKVTYSGDANFQPYIRAV